MASLPDPNDPNLDPLDDLQFQEGVELANLMDNPLEFDGVSLAETESIDLASLPLANDVGAMPLNTVANTVVSPVAKGNTSPSMAAAGTPASEEEAPIVPLRRSLWSGVPAWTISMMVHVAILLIMAAVSLDPIQGALAVMVAGGTVAEESNGLEEFDIENASDDMQVEETDGEEVPDTLPQVQTASEVKTDVKLDSSMVSNFANLTMPSLTQQLTPSEMLTASSSAMKKTLNSRSTKMKREMLERYGGNKDSEKAVSMALKWLAEHQLPDGSWSFAHNVACRGRCDHPGNMREARNAATGMALLPFLGAGQTHMEGEYKQVVYRGLSFLLDSMKVQRGDFPTGSWAEGGSNLYGHGIASIAVCEAYAMTGDETLANPAQLSLNFIMYAQNPDGGGWQYAPRQGGDTSVVGWQLMALKSGAMGGLVVQVGTLKKAEYFLDSVQVNGGAFYGYDKPDANIDGRLATTACGLLCRMYMGWQKTHPALLEGVNYIGKRGPDPTNMYYNYYATQVMKQQGGALWEAWNPRMRDQLVKSQDSTGHSAGSWTFADQSVGNPAEAGGRLYLTAMSTMILEVYYRYMPIYGDQMEDEAFKL